MIRAGQPRDWLGHRHIRYEADDFGNYWNQTGRITHRPPPKRSSWPLMREGGGDGPRREWRVHRPDGHERTLHGEEDAEFDRLYAAYGSALRLLPVRMPADDRHRTTRAGPTTP